MAEAARRYGFAGARDRLARAGRRRARAAVRQLGPQQPARRADDRRRRGGQARDLREAARAATPPSRTRPGSAWQAAGVKHMCAFNYRFVPAVRLAREIIEAGELGEITHFRGAYLQEWGATDDEVWRFDKAVAGSGALGDLGAHVIDLARYLVGEIESVVGRARRPSSRAARSTTRSSPSSRFESGAVGTIEATRFATGPQERLHVGDQRLEGLDRVRPRAAQRAAGPRRRTRPRRSRRRASGRSSSPRPTTRSGSTGGRTATSSAGSTPSSTSCTTC